MEMAIKCRPFSSSGFYHYCKLTCFEQFNRFKREHGLVGSLVPYGLPGYDITKWPRKLRAEYNFEHVDPLAAISDEDLRENKIMISHM